MLEKKKDLLKSKKFYRRCIRYLKKLQTLCWSTTYVPTWRLIEDTEEQLRKVQLKLKNKKYV